MDLSDHGAFWKKASPAVMLTDTALCRNPHYHRDMGRPNTLAYPAMAELTGGLYDALLELDRASRERSSSLPAGGGPIGARHDQG